VAQALNRLHLATLLFDLLTPEEALDRDYVFDIPLLASRLKEAYRWLLGNPSFNRTPVGFFGASTGAAAAATAAAELGTGVSALVSRGGRVDLARASLSKIQCPTLLIVGGWDEPVLSWNREVLTLLKKGSFKVIPKATHLFEEPHAMPAVLDAAGTTLLRAARFEPATELIDIHGSGGSSDGIELAEPTDDIIPFVGDDLPDIEAVWHALVLGVRDYVTKNGFPSIALGLSGGIDSAVCAVIAADAIGATRVFGVSMPSKYSSDGSKDDARALAETIGCHYDVQPIAELVTPFETQLGLTGVAAENIQARARGMILMALSNQHGHLILTTGNKSEVAVGYSTMYGDTVGGFAPLKDVFKTLVWDLARWRNAFAESRGETPPIPVNSITKPPSAELRPDQTDQDSLPPYDVLDAILDHLVSRRDSIDSVVEAGFDRATVERIAGLVAGSEWKRRQGAIGPRISRMAFGRERRLPITVKHTRGLG
jgi:NAD+ synthetase